MCHVQSSVHNVNKYFMNSQIWTSLAANFLDVWVGSFAILNDTQTFFVWLDDQKNSGVQGMCPVQSNVHNTVQYSLNNYFDAE